MWKYGILAALLIAVAAPSSGQSLRPQAREDFFDPAPLAPEPEEPAPTSPQYAPDGLPLPSGLAIIGPPAPDERAEVDPDNPPMPSGLGGGPTPAVPEGEVEEADPIPDQPAESTSVEPAATPLITRPQMRPPPPETAVTASLRPSQRPSAVVLQGEKQAALRRAGAVCNDIDIQGEAISAIPGRLPGCGQANPVRIRSILGIKLSQRSIMDCRTARAVKSWIANGVNPAVSGYRGGVRELHVMAHYNCRTRNNQPGAKISEHGRGHAIDIGALRMKDGSEISVLRDWGQGKPGQILQRIHRAACGPFGTVLGPNANRFHRDHFHFDTARYRSGSYCR